MYGEMSKRMDSPLCRTCGEICQNKCEICQYSVHPPAHVGKCSSEYTSASMMESYEIVCKFCMDQPGEPDTTPLEPGVTPVAIPPTASLNEPHSPVAELPPQPAVTDPAPPPTVPNVQSDPARESAPSALPAPFPLSVQMSLCPRRDLRDLRDKNLSKVRFTLKGNFVDLLPRIITDALAGGQVKAKNNDTYSRPGTKKVYVHDIVQLEDLDVRWNFLGVLKSLGDQLQDEWNKAFGFEGIKCVIPMLRDGASGSIEGFIPGMLALLNFNPNAMARYDNVSYAPIHYDGVRGMYYITLTTLLTRGFLTFTYPRLQEVDLLAAIMSCSKAEDWDKLSCDIITNTSYVPPCQEFMNQCEVHEPGDSLLFTSDTPHQSVTQTSEAYVRMVYTNQFAVIGIDPRADAPLWWPIIVDAYAQSRSFAEFNPALRSLTTWRPIKSFERNILGRLKEFKLWAQQDVVKGKARSTTLPVKEVALAISGKEEAPVVPTETIDLTVGAQPVSARRSDRQIKHRCSHSSCLGTETADVCTRCGVGTACPTCTRGTSSYKLTMDGMRSGAQALRFCDTCARTSSVLIQYDRIRVHSREEAMEADVAVRLAPGYVAKRRAAPILDFAACLDVAPLEFAAICEKLRDEPTTHTDLLVRRRIFHYDGNELCKTAESHYGITSSADLIPASYKKPQPSPGKKPQPSPVKGGSNRVEPAQTSPEKGRSKETQGGITSAEVAMKFVMDQELQPFMKKSTYYTVPGDIEVYKDDEDETYELRGKRVIGVKENGRMVLYAPY